MRGKVVITHGTSYDSRESNSAYILAPKPLFRAALSILFIFTSSFVFFFTLFTSSCFYLFSLLICFVSLFTSCCFVSNITKSIVPNIFISDNQTLLADLQDFCHLTANFMLISLTKDVKENFIVFSCEHNGAHLVLSFEASSSFPII